MKLQLRKETKSYFTVTNLREVLKTQGVTQSALARLFKISRAYMNDIVAGRRHIPKEMIQYWKEQYNISISIREETQHD